MALGLTLLAAMWVVSPAMGQGASPCDDFFPDQEWQLVQAGSGVSTFRASLDEGVAARFGDDAEATAQRLVEDLGSFPPSTLCVFGSDTALDGSGLEEEGLLPPGQRLHAASFREEAVLFVDAQQFRLVPEAIALGLAETALWHLSGSEGYPEPLAGAIAQWYAARQSGKLEQHHSTMRVATFFNDPTGTAPPTPWLAGAQEPVAVWNPEFQESPISDFIEHAVAANGPSILVDPQPDAWAAADIAWKADLRDELLQGADRSREWVGGVVIATLVVVAAIAMAWWGRRVARRKQEAIADIAVVDGDFFDRTPEKSDA